MFSPDVKVKVQNFGRFLSNMVMPNIGAFIAWGIITALFIPTGWLPNETLGKLVGPMITYLLPLLIGYTGGKLVGGERGGVNSLKRLARATQNRRVAPKAVSVSASGESEAQWEEF